MNIIDTNPDAILLDLETRRRAASALACETQTAADKKRASLKPKIPEILMKQVTLPSGEATKRPFLGRKEINRDFDAISMCGSRRHKATVAAWAEYEAALAAVNSDPEYIALQEEADKCSAEGDRIEREIAETSARGIEGISVKLRLAIGDEAVSPEVTADELALRSALADCERMMGADGPAVRAYADVQRAGGALDRVDVDTPEGATIEKAYLDAAKALEAAPITSNADAAAKLRFALGSGCDLSAGTMQEILESILAHLDATSA